MLSKIKNKKYKTSLSRGFTLVESLVAISVLLVGVIGPLSLAASAIADGIFARNQITANYLAQEAMEVVINKRYALARRAQYIPPTSPDTLFSRYYDNQFFDCINLSLTAGSYCSVDPQGGSIISTALPCTASDNYTNCKLVYNNTSHLYQKPTTPQLGDVGPTFTRKVQITPSPAGSTDQVKVTVQVDWNNKATPKSLILVEHLFSQG